MKSKNLWIVSLLTLAVLQFWACQKKDHGHHFEHPSEVEDIPGSEFSRVTFTEKAMERTGVETAAVKQEASSPLKKVVPYGALLYGPEGQTWVYTSPEPRVFIRMEVDVDYIKGNKVYLNEGPPVGTIVVSVGAAEIYGTEFEIGH
jgi:hypothetical protein